MNKNLGGVLPIVLILTVALFSLTALMYMVNRQYQVEIEVMDESIEERQMLLSVGKSILQDIEGRDKERFIEWPQCDLLAIPQLSLHATYNVYYQKAILDEKCGFGYQAYRVWLVNNKSQDILLVADALVLDQEEWSESVAVQEESVEVVFKEGAWNIQMVVKHQFRDILIFEDEDERVLRYRKIRQNKDNYEFVLLFENKDTKSLELYRLIASINESRMNEIHELSVDIVEVVNGKEIISQDLNIQRLQNWKLLLSGIKLNEIQLYNEVLFLAFEQSNDVGIIALSIDGEPFFGEGKLGVQKTFNKDELDEYILISCYKNNSVLVGGVWQIGCFNQKVIRYFYSVCLAACIDELYLVKR